MNFKKSVSILLTLLFLLFAFFQRNDPDPMVWIAIYLLAAVACFSLFMGKTPHNYVFWVMATGYLIAAVLQWPPQFEGILFGEMKMRSLNIELARESLGLVICALAMALMGWLSKR